MKNIQLNKKNRDSNLELFRIIVMLSIVANHYTHYIKDEIFLDPFSPDSLFMYSFGMWGKIGINCFVLITGYFMCNSNISIRKYLKLYIEIKLYAIIIYVLFLTNGKIEFQLSDLRMLLPFDLTVEESFLDGFMSFYLLIPFLNYFLQKVNKKQLSIILIISLCFYILPKYHAPMHYIIWFCILYLISAYIKTYGIIKNNSLGFWVCMSILTAIISYLSIIFCIKFSLEPYAFVKDSNVIMAVATSISLFMLFKNIEIKHNKYINLIASTTFGIFLIHTSGEYMRDWLWNDCIRVKELFGQPYFWIYSISAVICIFIICSIIDLIRIKFLEPIYLKVLDRYFSNKKYYHKISI